MRQSEVKLKKRSGLLAFRPGHIQHYCVEIGKRAFELVPIFLSKLLGQANGRSYFYLFLLENIHS